MNELKPCPFCDKNPIIEHWCSGGWMHMVKFSNPNCPVPDKGYPTGHSLEEVKREWNRRANDGT